MVETRNCSFCGDEIEPGTGLMLVEKDGTRHHFCSSKCEKNADLGRVPREVEWTEKESGEGLEGEVEAEEEA
ncbi:MAG: 50S ribosomal protein L24e [Halobacteria archaeon]|nr:50S ribosomal protein L24e [Halobacteria archaeon]